MHLHLQCFTRQTHLQSPPSKMFVCFAGLLTAFLILFNRVRIALLLRYLERVKRATAYRRMGARMRKAYKIKYKQSCFLLPLIWINTIFDSLVLNLSAFFLSDRQSTYLKKMFRRNTKENTLFSMSAIFTTGVLFTIAYFYIQLYLLERFERNTLCLVLTILVTTAVLPLFSRLALALSLLVIPTSIVMAIRAAVISLVLLELQVIAWSNIRFNADTAISSIGCEVKSFRHFLSNFKIGQGSNQKANIVWESDFIQELIAQTKKAYQAIAYAFHVLSQAGAVVISSLEDFARTINPFEFLGWLKCLLDFVVDLIKKLISWVVDIINSLTSQITHGIKEKSKKILQDIKKELRVKFVKNHTFAIESDQTKTLKGIYRESASKLIEKHAYISYILDVCSTIMDLYIFYVFFRIFGLSLYYLIMFLNVKSHDNRFITDDLIQYDQEMIANGEKPLLPLYLWEKSIYVRPGRPELAGSEMQAVSVAFFIDLTLLSYTLFLLALDSGVYNIIILLDNFTKLMTYDLITEPKDTKIPVVEGFLEFNISRLAKDVTILREQLGQCAPTPSPVEWNIYTKCLKLLGILFLLMLFKPYISRTRHYICSTLFPHLVRPRSIYLYNRICFRRILFTCITMILPLPPGVVGILQAKEIVPEQELVHLEKPNWFTWLWSKLDLSKSNCPTCKQCRILLPESIQRITCPGWNCNSNFCTMCFVQLNNKCPNCHLEFEVASELSEELDSSCEDINLLFGKESIKQL